MTASAPLRALCTAAALLAGATPAVGCPPPPPVPTPAEQALTFWNRVDSICLVRLDRGELARSDLPALQAFALADGRWQLPMTPLERWKGECAPGTVHFVDIPAVLCGGGMPPFDTLLVAGLTAERVMTVWTPADSPFASALRALAGAQRP